MKEQNIFRYFMLKFFCEETLAHWLYSLSLRSRRFELPWGYPHNDLNVAHLPASP